MDSEVESVRADRVRLARFYQSPDDCCGLGFFGVTTTSNSPPLISSAFGRCRHA